MLILLIEDNKKLNKNICTILEGNGYDVIPALKGTEGIDKANDYQFDLIILDLNLPDIDGINVCRIIRNAGIKIPIIMLTARIDTESKISGLDTGADDYLTKPFESEELLARIRALLRRGNDTLGARVGIGDVMVDLRSKKVTKNNKEIKLSATEMRILEYLINHRGEVCKSINILESVWGVDADNLIFSDTLKVHIARMRKKLGGGIIKTSLQQGYMIE